MGRNSEEMVTIHTKNLYIKNMYRLLFETLRRHLTANLRASDTSFCTFLAMFMIMFAAFVSTGLTDFSTELAYLLCEWAATLHGFNSKCTYIGAFPVHSNTICHHFQIIFLEAGIITDIACFHTFKTSLYAFFISHIHY
ncbi:hypothetical protein WQ57_12135 [Mesobacillus campisalis]|uniref:Uncharacterized protein n=1 Tax=Mesobacillus campisalis TaxID=1408103 RepID=A0A0M2SZ85_9BACI|nr:hypothetical protein WQ57_12135 [Mesobacillus campisalis]